MNCKLTRTRFESYGILGVLTDEAGNYVAVTLEHAFDKGWDGWLPAVPVGSYTCKRRLSPHFGYDVFEIQNVPKHTYVEIHRGNFNKDSDGCVLLGSRLGSDCVIESEVAFDRFMALQQNIDSFTLVVENKTQLKKEKSK